MQSDVKNPVNSTDTSLDFFWWFLFLIYRIFIYTWLKISCVSAKQSKEVMFGELNSSQISLQNILLPSSFSVAVYHILVPQMDNGNFALLVYLSSHIQVHFQNKHLK